MNKYSYEKEVYDLSSLTKEIQDSSITIALDHIDGLGNDIDIWFKAALSEAEETTLDGLVSSHTGEPLPQDVVSNVKLVEDSANKKALDGKTVQQTTSRKIGTYAYYSGSGDDADNVFNTGGSNDSHLICGKHTIGEATTQIIYTDLNTVINETHIWAGYIQFMGAISDLLSFEIVPKLTEYEASENTNFNIYGGVLIVPAAGDGLITPTNIKLVQCVANEFGDKNAGYWNADFNTSTGEFENITAAPNGDGDWNMFVAEMILSRFVNKFLMLGDNNISLLSNDITQIPHGTMMKSTYVTRGEDHVWSWNCNLSLFRKKTC